MAMTSKVVCITQARSTSTRLPRKVLLNMAGSPLLTHHLSRLQRCSLVHEIVLATTSNRSDDEVAALGSSQGLRVVRGSEDDVLARFVTAAQASAADIVVRVTSDCPLIDPGLVDRVIQAFLDDPDLDYAHLDMTHLPRGLDTEVFRRTLLEKAHEDPATTDFEREHVTPYIYRRPEKYRLKAIDGHGTTPPWRWCVDEPGDFELVSRMLEALLPQHPYFTWRDAAQLLERHPQWIKLNEHVQQKSVLPP